MTYINLPGYNMQYGKKGWSTLAYIILQIPKILIKVNMENRWLRAFLKENPVDAVISDNRFGLYSKKVRTVFISHQLGVKSNLGGFLDRITKYLNYSYIKRFNTCWVPDYNGQKAIAGTLSNPEKLPALKVLYIGGISRFEPCNEKDTSDELLIILSGPEPQRSIFEKILLNDLNDYTGKVTFVRGLPGNADSIEAPAGVTVYNHVPASKLNTLVCNAGMVISRTGYTTVMDLFKLGKKSILVPTPGQTEQEYLARYLYDQHLAYTASQKNFSLKKVLEAAKDFPFRQVHYSMEEYKTIIHDFVQALQS